MVQTDLLRKSNYTFYVQMRFPESRAIYETMWKKYGVARQATGGNKICHTRLAFWINKAIDIHSECVTLIAFQGKKLVTRRCLNITLYRVSKKSVPLMITVKKTRKNISNSFSHLP
jgi:hypothetical protein